MLDAYVKRVLGVPVPERCVARPAPQHRDGFIENMSYT